MTSRKNTILDILTLDPIRGNLAPLISPTYIAAIDDEDCDTDDIDDSTASTCSLDFDRAGSHTRLVVPCADLRPSLDQINLCIPQAYGSLLSRHPQDKSLFRAYPFNPLRYDKTISPGAEIGHFVRSPRESLESLALSSPRHKCTMVAMTKHDGKRRQTSGAGAGAAVSHTHKGVKSGLKNKVSGLTAGVEAVVKDRSVSMTLKSPSSVKTPPTNTTTKRDQDFRNSSLEWILDNTGLCEHLE